MTQEQFERALDLLIMYKRVYPQKKVYLSMESLHEAQTLLYKGYKMLNEEN